MEVISYDFIRVHYEGIRCAVQIIEKVSRKDLMKKVTLIWDLKPREDLDRQQKVFQKGGAALSKHVWQ